MGLPGGWRVEKCHYGVRFVELFTADQKYLGASGELSVISTGIHCPNRVREVISFTMDGFKEHGLI